MRYKFKFRPNQADELHCVPATVGMLIEGMLDIAYSEDELEKICGFVPGREVWQFAWMLNLADRGVWIRSVEDFDPEGFINDPRKELLRGTGDRDVVERIYEVSDVDNQVGLVEKCIAHPGITFEQRIPSMKELEHVLSNDTAALVNINARVLAEREGYAGHLVLLHKGDENSLLIEDPGPPPHKHLALSGSNFLQAWQSPTESMANYILCGFTS